MMKYRKKPIIVEAYQTEFDREIETLEGVMIARKGDYIITGVNGEVYPCKPDIFEKTYEKVDDGSKPLEAFEEIISTFYDKDSEEIRIVKTALKEYELMKEIKYTARFDLAQVNKEHKALEIIKSKKMLSVFKDIISGQYFIIFNDIAVEIPQEEYNLLKEVLL